VQISNHDSYPNIISRIECNLEDAQEHDLVKNGKVYVTTNETDTRSALATLEKAVSVGNLAIGVSCFCTLDIASVRENISHILIVDCCEYTELFWEKIAPIIKNSSNRNDCIQKIGSHIRANKEVYFSALSATDQTEQVEEHIFSMETRGWLSTNKGYNKVKIIFDKNCFAFKRLNLCDVKACRVINELHQRMGLKTDTIYLSNVIEFISPENLPSYGQSVELLTSQNSIIVDTRPRPFKNTLTFFEKFPKDGLELFINFPREYNCPPPEFPAQQVRLRDSQTIPQLYPLIEFASNKAPQDVFYDFGIAQEYFTEEEMEEVEDRAYMMMQNKPNATSHDLLQAVFDIIYSKAAPLEEVEEPIDLISKIWNWIKQFIWN